jgi:hypothetical protein
LYGDRDLLGLSGNQNHRIRDGRLITRSRDPDAIRSGLEIRKPKLARGIGFGGLRAADQRNERAGQRKRRLRIDYTARDLRAGRLRSLRRYSQSAKYKRPRQ